MTWWMYAFGSALAAAATAILAKIGIKGVPSNLATALRTAVVLLFAWGFVFAAGEQSALRTLKTRSIVFLVLSGVGTAASWLCYFRALQMAPASRVAPIDKLSLAFTLILAAFVLGESISWKVASGAALMVLGAYSRWRAKDELGRAVRCVAGPRSPQKQSSLGQQVF